MPKLIKVAVLIKEKDSFLLVQEKGMRVYGLWNLPQGTLEVGESLANTAIREVKEETGLNIQIKRKIKILNNTFTDTKELHVYEGHKLGGTINFPKNEILNVQYFTLKQVEEIKDKLVGDWVYDLIYKNN